MDDCKTIANRNDLGLKSYLKQFTVQINKLSKNINLNFFAEEYKNYFRDIWEGEDIKKELYIRNICASKASKLLGTSKKIFLNLINEGGIETRTVYVGKSKLILIDKLLLENYKNDLENSYENKFNRIKKDIAKKNGYLTVAEASNKLETSRTTTVKIVKDHSIRQGRKILILEDFVDSLTELIKYKSEIFNGELELFNFYYAQRYFIRNTERTLKDFYKFIFSIKVKCYLKKDRIGFERLFFNKNEFIQKLNSYEWDK